MPPSLPELWFGWGSSLVLLPGLPLARWGLMVAFLFRGLWDPQPSSPCTAWRSPLLPHALAPPAAPPMTQGLCWGAQNPHKRCQGAHQSWGLQGWWSWLCWATVRRLLMGGLLSSCPLAAQVSWRSCCWWISGPYRATAMVMSFLTKCAVKPLRLDCSFCNKVASSYPYLQMNPRMMFYFACTSHHPSVQIQLISCFSHRSRSPLSWMFLKKGSPDLKQEVVLGAWNEHWLCRPLHILKAITWVCCGVQDRTLKIVIIWPHWVLNCSYLMPTYGTSWLFCPPQCTAITKLVKTGHHIGHIILAVSQMRQFDGTSMAMEEIDRSWKCHLLKYKFSYSLVQRKLYGALLICQYHSHSQIPSNIIFINVFVTLLSRLLKVFLPWKVRTWL